MRSATNMILVAMAQSDMLTGLWPLPCYLYFYTLEHAVDYVPDSWCFIYHCLTDYLPTIFHTASVWLTVGLAVHRCAAASPAITTTTTTITTIIIISGQRILTTGRIAGVEFFTGKSTLNV